MSGREYGPTAGIKPLRAAVANLYNENYRQGKESKYTWENVCIVPGGRAGLIRIAAVLGSAYLAFFIPDYTAYNEMLSLFKNVGDAEVLTAGRSTNMALASSSRSRVPSPAQTSTTSTLTRSPKS